MNVLVLNCGSSSVKFQLISTDLERIEQDADRRLAHGLVERVGGAGIVTFTAEGNAPKRFAEPVRDTRAAVEMILRWAVSPDSGVAEVNSIADIHAVGHRVVHGGERFTSSMLITDEVLRGIEDCIELAPLHNPANIHGIVAARTALGAALPQVAVFDTAFHQTLPDHAFLYALPYQLYRRHRIRRYGFHGTSHRYIAYRYRKLKGIARDATNIITLHLGNGCSIAAIKDGNSIDTSMGFTPLEGLVMGTRSGDLDPSIIDLISTKEGLSLSEVESLLNKQSGLLGISGLTDDMRELLAEAHEQYIGSYLAAMNGAEAIVFTGGIGENSAEIRERICAGLSWLGIELDAERNSTNGTGSKGQISSDSSRVSVFVIPTNEELLIARDTVRVVSGAPKRF
jgi:acetate kinase